MDRPSWAWRRGLSKLIAGHTISKPTRLTVDLFRAARGVPTAVTVRVVRDGRRIRSAECDVAQENRLVARARLLQYRRSAAPPGRLWVAPMTFPSPPSLDDGVLTVVGSDVGDWSRWIGPLARRGMDRCAGRIALGSRRSRGRDGDAFRPVWRFRIRHDHRGQ
jgi:Thioesterase-like superfamily